MKPAFIFDFWGLPIYNLLGAIGVFFALAVFLRRERELNVSSADEDKLNASFILAGASALLPANAANWFFKPELLAFPLRARILAGGLTFYYGMFGFFAVFALSLKLRKMNTRLWINEVVPSVLIFHAFGRIGCSLAGCCYGVDLTASAGFSRSRVTLFPARELEAVCLFALFFVFRYKVKEHKFKLYLLSYSILRFFLEFGRGDYRGTFAVRFLSPAQVTSALIWIFLAGLCAEQLRLKLRPGK